MSLDKRSQKDGVVLVAVLWALIVLAVLVAALVSRVRLDMMMHTIQADEVVARWLAMAGVETAMATLQEDSNSTDCQGDDWYDQPGRFQGTLEEGTYTVCADRLKSQNACCYGVMDEASKLNVNTADYAMLIQVPGMTDTMAKQILAERARQTTAGFETIRSLARLGGMDQKSLCGEDSSLNGVPDRGLMAYLTCYSFEWNRDGQNRKRINLNTATEEILRGELALAEPHVKWILLNRPFQRSVAEVLGTVDERAIAISGNAGDDLIVPVDVETFMRIADRITIDDRVQIPGRVNVNTASVEVLRCLPGMDVNLARTIAQEREMRPGGFSDIGQLLQVTGMSIERFGQLARWVCVRSNVFTIRSLGTALRTSREHTIETVVMRDMDRLKTFYWKEGS